MTVLQLAYAGIVNGVTLADGLRWPTLPASVSQELAELKAIVASPTKLAAFHAKLPPGFLEGSIAIHHTHDLVLVPTFPGEMAPLEAHACYDAVIEQGGDLGVTQCYLPDGALFTYAPD